VISEFGSEEVNLMLNRLVELLYRAHHNTSCVMNEGGSEDEMLEEEARYLLKYGVILPPCKVGDNCYPLPRYKTPIVERKISRITYSARNVIIGYYENDGQYRPPLRTRTLGEDVFLAREEAEQALKGDHNG
jgi:hypothetical protein